MSLIFKRGDLVLFFNKNMAFMAILDEVDEDHFTIITSEDQDYHYGFKIRKRNLDSNFFLKLDSRFPQTDGIWKFFQHDDELMNNMLSTFKESV